MIWVVAYAGFLGVLCRFFYIAAHSEAVDDSVERGVDLAEFNPVHVTPYVDEGPQDHA